MFDKDGDIMHIFIRQIFCIMALVLFIVSCLKHVFCIVLCMYMLYKYFTVLMIRIIHSLHISSFFISMS